MASRTNLQAWVKLASAADTEWTAYTVDADGEFDLTGLTAGETYDISVPPEYLTRTFVADSAPSVTITAISVSEGTGVTVNPTYGGTNRVYSLSGPDWLTINPSTGQVAGTAPDEEFSGSYTVTVTNAAGSASDTETVTVTEAGANTFEATIADFSRADNIYDQDQSIALSGTCDAGADGLDIEVRSVQSDGTQILGWKTVGTASGTSWTGGYEPDGQNLSEWGFFEARVVGSTATPGRQTTRSAVGRAVANFGQSDGPLGTYVTGGLTAPNPNIPAIPSDGVVQIYVANATRQQVNDANPISVGLAQFARDYLTINPGRFLVIADHVKGATSQIQLAANDAARPWADEVTVANAFKTDGVVPSRIISGWWHGATGLGADFAKFIAPFYTGKLLDGTDVTADIEGGSYTISAGGSARSITHYIRELYPDASVSKFVFVDHQEANTGTGPGSLIAVVQGALGTNPDSDDQRASLEAFSGALAGEVVSGIWAPSLYSYELDPADPIHPTLDLDGVGRHASQTANIFSVMLGYEGYATPEYDDVTWASGSVQFNSTQGGLTTVRVEESVAALSGYPNRGLVTGLQLNGAPVSDRSSIDGSGNIVITMPSHITLDGDDVLRIGGGGNAGALSTTDDTDNTCFSLPVISFPVTGALSPYLNLKGGRSFSSTLTGPTRYAQVNGDPGDILDSADVATASSLTFDCDIIFGDIDAGSGTLFERADGGFEVGNTTLNRLLLRFRDTAGTELVGGDLQLLPSIFVNGRRVRLTVTAQLTGGTGGTMKVFLEGSEVYTQSLAANDGNLLVGDTGMGSRGNGFGARGDRTVNYYRFAENVYLSDGDTSGVTWRFWRTAAGFVENSSTPPV